MYILIILNILESRNYMLVKDRLNGIVCSSQEYLTSNETSPAIDEVAKSVTLQIMSL